MLLEKNESSIRHIYQSIFKASLAFAAGDVEQVWRNIAEGLQIDGSNYELHMMLGDYYAGYNLQQAYLCYENALFYCNVEEDRVQIQAVIVVDNASKDKSVAWLKQQKDMKLLCNEENCGFPIGCNQGIRMAEKESDILLLNNDTIMTPNALFWLHMGLYENDQVGSTGSVSNYVANGQAVIENGKIEGEYFAFARKNNVPMENSYVNKASLDGFALLLKRCVLEKTGYLDERFSPGNFEDNDICLRIMLSGYRNVLCKNSFIIHWGSLPKCYDEREKIIKKTASLPWILGDINILLDLQRKGILNPECYENIKMYWEQLSDISLEVLKNIAYGKYSK